MIFDKSGLDKTGFVLKKGIHIPTYNRRYMSADPVACKLIYWKDKPDGTEQPRGELSLQEAQVEEAEGANPEFRFTVTTPVEVYNLEAQDARDMREWLRSIQMLSRLGVFLKRTKIEEQKQDVEYVFHKAFERMQQSLREQQNESREALREVANHKWRAKRRLTELRDNMLEKLEQKKQKFLNLMKEQEELKNSIELLNTELEIVREDVSASNKLQKQVVGIMQQTGGSLQDKLRTVMQYCKEKVAGAPRPPTLKSGIQLVVGAGVDIAFADLWVPATVTGFTEQIVEVKFAHGGQVQKKNILRNKIDQKLRQKQKSEEKQDSKLDVKKTKTKPRKSADFKSNPVLFEDAMMTEINKSKLLNSRKMRQGDPDEVEYTFNIYRNFYVNVHLPRELELIRIKTKCSERYNGLRHIQSQQTLITREKNEINWILTEMNRAINRLTAEGTVDPDGKDKSNSKTAKQAKQSQSQRNMADDGPMQVVAHRPTWSDASNIIFRLARSRKDQLNCTRELEEALKCRELLRSWYDDYNHNSVQS